AAVTQDGDLLGRFSFNGVRINGTGGSSSGAGWFEMIQKGSATGVPGQFQIITSNGLGDRNPRLVVNPVGNVGIGTQNPEAMLHLAGNLYLSDSYSQIDFNNNSGTSDRMIIRKHEGYFGEINVISDHGLRLRTADQDRISITNDGFVGIGTNDPLEKLDVEGNLDMNGYQIKNMVIENRTSDPSNPAVGQIWLRTDL
ncbi:MAG: hypothetical protein K8R53_07640, partial [Bacteroidales bacterium]|nr:hypothetical protein [Bacteroidales bacterium]